MAKAKRIKKVKPSKVQSRDFKYVRPEKRTPIQGATHACIHIMDAMKAREPLPEFAVPEPKPHRDPYSGKRWEPWIAACKKCVEALTPNSSSQAQLFVGAPIFVYAVGGPLANGYQCEHAVADPKKDGEVVLCTRCERALARGTKIVKQESRELNPVN